MIARQLPQERLGRLQNREIPMRRYIVVAHKTLGGANLLEHIRQLREDDPYCRFHVVVPTHRPAAESVAEESVHAQAREALDEVLDRLAAMRIGATGEVGEDDPVDAVGHVIEREGSDAFAGIVVSTLPLGISRWWHADVVSRLEGDHPDIAITHLVADERLFTSEPIEPFLLPPPF